MRRRDWIVVIEHHEGMKKPTVRLVIPVGESIPRERGEIQGYLMAAIQALPYDTALIPVKRIDAWKPRKIDGKTGETVEDSD